MAEEKVQFNYDYLIEYLEAAQNVIGASTSVLRTITAHNDGNSIYVRKFGTDYLITDVSDIEDPVDVNMTFIVKALDGTELGRRTGGGAFVGGGTVSPAQGCYLEIEADGGNVIVLSTITIDTDVDPGGKTFVCAAETITDGDTLTLYLSDTTSTYYDSEYKYGGARHTPDSTSGLPYFDPETAVADPDGTGFTITTVLDSDTYDMQFAISIAGMILQADDGQTPTVTSGSGARTTREVEHDGNNTDTIYVSKTGDDANPGTYQSPYFTVQFAENNMGGLTYLKIMDSGIYIESITVNSAISIEPLYGKTPVIKNESASGANSFCIFLTDNNANIYGIDIDGFNRHHGIFIIPASSYAGTIKDNTCFNAGGVNIYHNSGSAFNGTIESNVCYGASLEGINLTTIFESSGIITKNIIYNNGRGIILFGAGSGGTNICDTAINNNICYNHTSANASGLHITTGGTYSGICENNTFWNNYYGLVTQIVTFAGTFRNMISYSNTNFDLIRISGAFPAITESNYGTNDGFSIGAGNIITNPEFCKTTSLVKLGISANSGAYRTDTSSDDMGAHLRIIEYNESNIEINGFIIDGQDQYNNGVYILDSADHAGCSLKWCSEFDFQGIGIDPYDNDTNTDFTVSNCEIYNNGNGIKLSYGGNTVRENLIFRNAVYGIHSDRNSSSFNHNTFFGNQYGIYFESNTSGIIFKNNITHSNSISGIFSEVLFSITYCCITDGSATVNSSDESNFIDDPLFLNEIIGSEDFNIKTKFGGFPVSSPCFLTSDDSPAKDIGAYDVVRSVAEEAWKKYVVESNPSNMNPEDNPVGLTRFAGALGSRSVWAKDIKNVFPLEWDQNANTTEKQTDMIRYLSRSIPTRANEKTKDQRKIRFFIVPTAHRFNGTNGIINASDKTIVDSAIDLSPDKHAGFFTGVIFASGTGMVIDAGAKTGTKAGAGWTVDEHTGRYLKYNGYPYYIKSNTATVLALSDPYSTLVSATIDYSIEKYFEIQNHDETTFNLIDDDSELVSGTYDYYIDFAETRSMDPRFAYSQARFAFSRKEWMTGYNLLLESI